MEVNETNRAAYESVYVRIKTNKKLLIIATIYRPLKTTLENDKLLYEPYRRYGKHKHFNDRWRFNLPRINWRPFSEGSRLTTLMKKKKNYTYPNL